MTQGLELKKKQKNTKKPKTKTKTKKNRTQLSVGRLRLGIWTTSQDNPFILENVTEVKKSGRKINIDFCDLFVFVYCLEFTKKYIIHSEKCLVIIFVKKRPPLPLLNLFPPFSVRYTTLLHWKLVKFSELSLIMICSEYRQFTHFTLSTRRCLSSSEKWRLEPKENLFCSCKRQQECSYNY